MVVTTKDQSIIMLLNSSERLVYISIVFLLAHAIDISHQIYEHTWSEILVYVWQSISVFWTLNGKLFPIVYFIGLIPLGIFVILSFLVLVKFTFQHVLY